MATLKTDTERLKELEYEATVLRERIFAGGDKVGGATPVSDRCEEDSKFYDRCAANAAVNPDLINHMFSYHPPRPDQIPHYEEIREAAKAFARAIERHVPDCNDRRGVLNTLSVCAMLANRAIACDGVSF